MMREILMAAAEEAYGDHRPDRARPSGHDGWATVVGAVALLAAGTLALGLAMVI